MELRREKIDVKVSVAASNVPGGANDVSGFQPADDDDDDDKTVVCCSSCESEGPAPTPTPQLGAGGGGFGASASYSFSKTEESKDKVSQETSLQTELNVGGRQGGTWKVRLIYIFHLCIFLISFFLSLPELIYLLPPLLHVLYILKTGMGRISPRKFDAH